VTLKDIKITAKLRIGLGIILVFVAVLGVVSWYQAESIWQQADGMYNHPLAVRRALNALNIDVFSLNRELGDFINTAGKNEYPALLKELSRHDAEVTRQIHILYESYLGPRTDLDEVVLSYSNWKASTDTILQIALGGNRSEAINRTTRHSLNRAMMDTLISNIRDVSEFAIARGDKFYRDALTSKTGLLHSLRTLLGIILALSVAISLFLVKDIRTPLKELIKVTGQFQRGKLGARSMYASRNEFGVLSESFNALAQTIQTEMESRENAMTAADVMLREEDLRSFSRVLLVVFLEHTQSQMAAMYLLNEQKTAFELVESIGLSAEARKEFSVETRQGEFGAALASGQVSHIRDIPEDAQFTFSAVSGDIKPREILTVPILSGTETVAMLSLASIKAFSPHALRFVNDVRGMLTARLNGVLAHQKIVEFSARLEMQNRELNEKTKELAVQSDELSEQNIELEMQKQQLDEANRLKNVFLSNMSHELRTPLNSVIALAGVLNRRLRNGIPEEEYGYLSIIERNGKQLLKLINDILDLSRIEAGREEVTLSRFSLRSLAGEIIAMFSVEAAQKNIELRNNVPDNLPWIQSDISRCLHILQNLIGNAVKFTSQGSVNISAEVAGQCIRITVEDTGIGISPDALPYIFDEFRQGDESIARKFGGTGLGLSIAKKYTTLLHGDIEVESFPGKGSSFILTLPILLPGDDMPPAEDTASSFDEKTYEESSVFPGLGRSILLVEDSQAAQIQIADILLESGYILHVAQNGREAVDHFAAAIPDAVILDLMMPEMNGFELLSVIRSDERTMQLPVLILTAKHISHEELRFLKGNNIHQLIRKGDISKDELLAAVANMVIPRPAAQPAPVKDIPRIPRTEKPVFLIIEDNPDNLETMKALLHETAFVVEAHNGPDGLAAARNRIPDLILADISLPGMDGYAVLQEIRKDERLRHLPVVAITARAMKGDREDILASGFDGYIAKPIEYALLRETIEEILYGN
jgi:signal transduction histidine kinase/DNA-binding response OmpR family regulator/methyl-accepting chemotaxis protein